jgi:hypothetical protein
MDNTEIQCIVLIDNTILISKIVAVVSELGEPDCRLINPCKIIDNSFVRWLTDITENDEIMISSDKILTLVDPKPSLMTDYLEFIK